MPTAYFVLRYAPELRRVLVPLGLGPARSGVRVEADSVTVRMGWAFRATIPRSALRAAVVEEAPVATWGVHGWGSSWLVSASPGDVVRLEIGPGARARALGVPVHLRTLRVAVKAPRDLVGAFEPERTTIPLQATGPAGHHSQHP